MYYFEFQVIKLDLNYLQEVLPFPNGTLRVSLKFDLVRLDRQKRLYLFEDIDHVKVRSLISILLPLPCFAYFHFLTFYTFLQSIKSHLYLLYLAPESRLKNAEKFKLSSLGLQPSPITHHPSEHSFLNFLNI